MYMRALAGATALALAAGSHAAISVSFASGSANVSHIFEIRQEINPRGGPGVITVQTVDNVEVDLIVNPSGPDLFTQRAGFEAMFYVDASGGPSTGGPFAFGGDLNGSFRFYDASNPSDTLLLGFVSSGLGFFVASDFPTGGGEGGEPPFGFLAGSLVGPGTSYFLNDPVNGSSLGFPGGGLMGDSAFTLTNFEEFFEADNGGNGQPFARATGSFSGTLIPSTGTGVLSALALGVVATRRRR
jgi:hypothetical protein